MQSDRYRPPQRYRIRRHFAVPGQNLYPSLRRTPHRRAKGWMGPVIGGPKGDALHLDHQKERRLITLLQTGAQLFHMLDWTTHRQFGR